MWEKGQLLADMGKSLFDKALNVDARVRALTLWIKLQLVEDLDQNRILWLRIQIILDIRLDHLFVIQGT